MLDISNVIKSTGVALEAEAFRQFGAAVQGVADTALSSIFKQPTTTTSRTDDNDGELPTAAQAADNMPEYRIWDSTRYASQNASTGTSSNANHLPRHKFLFKVSFIFNSGIAEYASLLGRKTVDELMRGLDYSVKQIDLPSVSFDYEMVNMYNFRTKVLKSITHDDISFTFYDDVSNESLDFVNLYRMLHMPIARRENASSDVLEDGGFAFTNIPTNLNSSFRGPLPSQNKNILSKIIIHQYYMKYSMSEKDIVKVNDFVFTNPRMSKLTLGGQDHEDSNFNMVTGTFDFDSLYIETGMSATTDDGNLWQARAPSAPMSPIDILSNYDQGTAVIFRGQQTPPGGARNPIFDPFVDIIAQHGQRAVQTSVATALRGAVGNNVMGRALEGAIGSVSGSLGAQVGRTVKSVGNGVVQGFALPTKTTVTDNAAPVTDLSVLYNGL